VSKLTSWVCSSDVQGWPRIGLVVGWSLIEITSSLQGGTEAKNTLQDTGQKHVNSVSHGGRRLPSHLLHFVSVTFT
jgi:hypothetical protein